MFLKKIELMGFKSFADKSIIIFEDEVTGIVGPNGCGKSNINDAIRWVLGEQSVKSLRGSSMSDVIFNGSSQRKAMNVAAVTLVFDNTRRLLPIEYDEVEITRKLHRQSGEGEYYINKTPCRLKDILNLVMDCGLGRDSLSIISQGNISAFADSKPEDRRALFEEAAGVAKYKKRKNESLSKLNRTQENLDRLQDIINELERQVGPLKKQAEKAKIYLEKKEQLKTIEISVLVDEIQKGNEQLQAMRQKKFELDSKKAVCETTIAVEDRQSNELREEIYTLDREISRLQEEYTKQSDQVHRLEAQKIELDEKRKYAIAMADTKAKQKELKAMMEEAQYEYENRYQRLEQLQTKMRLKKASIQQLSTSLAQVNQEYEQAKVIVARLENRLEVLKNMMASPLEHQHAVKTIIDAKINGILGVTSQLFEAENGYEQAISSALGQAMYHLVSVDEKSARDAIAFLKKNQSGRATFLPLSVMKPRYINKEHLLIAENSDGFLGIASDLVNYEEKFHDLCLSLFGNILVVDNLLHANELAKMLQYRYKIVSLDGDVVNRGGSMSGGKSKNHLTPLSLQSEYHKLNANYEGEKLHVNSLNDTISATQLKLEKTKASLVQMQIDEASLEPLVQSKWAKYERYKSELESIGGNIEISDSDKVKEDDLVVLLSTLHQKIDDISSKIKMKRERRMSLGNDVQRKDMSIRSLRKDLNQLQNEIHAIDLDIAKLETRNTSTLERLTTTYEMTLEYASSQIIDINIDEARAKVIELRKEISALGHVNLDAPSEYEQVNTRYEFYCKQKDDLMNAKDKILGAIDELDEIMIKQFKEMFDLINHELNDVFQALFGGGRARLFMVDPSDVLNTGIDIDVQPPGKQVQNIRLFSGGEKSLIAICVLFSILKARVIPLCNFDEVEAALDQANVERFAKYIAQFRDESQFIVVTHRPGTMEQCDSLYGVTMQQNGVSSLLKVKLKDALTMIDQNEVNE